MIIKNPSYIRLSSEPVADTIDVNDKGQVFCDLDHSGNIVGVEFLVDGEIRGQELGDRDA